MGPRPGKNAPTPLTRRSWLVGLAGFAGAWACAPARGWGDDDAGLESARKRAIASGISDLRTARTDHFEAIGNAPESYLTRALAICERLGRDYLAHFQAKGFSRLRWPRERMTVVALAGVKDFSAFLGEEADEALGGIYDLDANRLIVFDTTSQGDRATVSAARVNTFTLTHEALHQLAFNTGLLERHGDVPLCISEGLAMYGEVRKADGVSPLGQINRPRLEGLKLSRSQGQSWIPLPTLLVRDDAFLQPETEQLAYAQGWLLVYHLLRNKEEVPKLRCYLEIIAARQDAEKRLEDARGAFGDLDELDQELRRLATRLGRR